MADQISLTEATPILSEFADDPDYGELIELFVEGMSDKIADLEKAYAAGERAEMRSIAHQLKGAGGGYGFNVISIVAADLEMACKADDSARIDETFDRLIADLKRVST